MNNKADCKSTKPKVSAKKDIAEVRRERMGRWMH